MLAMLGQASKRTSSFALAGAVALATQVLPARAALATVGSEPATRALYYEESDQGIKKWIHDAAEQSAPAQEPASGTDPVLGKAGEVAEATIVTIFVEVVICMTTGICVVPIPGM